eukprot:SRR837773.1694.p1 GENE.SRR837773.1694~~SRR837773.1694.p1  ORF type:complete len:457 (-),score=64.71 SRR837773.1694:81-1250(-)
MGDYILFERTRNPCVAWCQKRMPSCRRESFFFYEFPVVALGGCAFVFFIAASIWSQSDQEENCRSAEEMYSISLYIGVTLFVLSFFGFVPFLEFFVHSPMIRQIHMAMRYYHVSEKPPSMIYVSDGGVQDCTGVLQLMLRRSGRILLVLAAEDPDDELHVLRETMRLAVARKLGAFYDPKDPRRDVSLLLDEFKDDKNQTFLHIGISYGWNRDEGTSAAGRAEGHLRQTGHLLVVKCRLPPSWAGELLEGPLTEAEVASTAMVPATETVGEGIAESGALCGKDGTDLVGNGAPETIGMQSERSTTTYGLRKHGEPVQQTQLAGCCCNCCHVMGCCNIGPKFPHVSNVNQCLTPALFSCLARLGRRLSEDAVDLISRSDAFNEPWERAVR